MVQQTTSMSGKEEYSKWDIVEVTASIGLTNSPFQKVYENPRNIKPLCAVIDSKEHIRGNVIKESKEQGHGKF